MVALCGIPSIKVPEAPAAGDVTWVSARFKPETFARHRPEARVPHIPKVLRTSGYVSLRVDRLKMSA